MRVCAMLLLARHHLRALSGVAVVSLCLVALRVWWSGDASTTPPLSHHLQFLHATNVSKFIDGPRHLSLEPVKPLEACKRSNGLDMLVVVPSSPHNIGARSAVRESWGVYLPPTGALVFYVGAVDQPSVQERLVSESQAHKDVAQDSTFPDSYATLTLKTLALLAWARQACPSAKFIFKVDDDVYLNVPRLHTLTQCLESAMHNTYKAKGSKSDSNLSGSDESACEEAKGLVSHHVDEMTRSYKSYVLGGHLNRGAKADRRHTSKWQLPKTEYHNNILPPYLSGGAYLLSSNVVPLLLDTARHTPMIRIEDIYLTGLVASDRLKLRLSHVDGFHMFRARWEKPCMYHNLLTAHGFTPRELRVTTHAALGLPDGACDGLFTRAGVAINMFLTSLFPRLPTVALADNDSDTVI